MDARAQIHEYRIEEAADALIEVLTARERLPMPAAMPKREVVELVARQAERARRREAFIYVPTIEGRTVKAPTRRFVVANWSEICEVCGNAGFYIVSQKGKLRGVRLGTLAEARAGSSPPSYSRQQRNRGFMA